MSLYMLWGSDSPFSSSGYGLMTRELVPRLIDLGNKIDICSIQQKEGFIPCNNYDILPVDGSSGGQNAMIDHCRFRGADFVLVHKDSFIFSDLVKSDVGVVFWSPADCQPLHHMTVENSSIADWNLCPSKFMYNELTEKHHIENCSYLPQSIDCSLFAPMDKIACKKWLGFDENDFVVSIVAVNRDFRKALYNQIEGFSIFSKKHSDARLYLHTNEVDEFYPIKRMLNNFGIAPKTRLVHKYKYMFAFIADGDMARIYSATDCLLAAGSEGCNLPAIQAQSCNTPVIGADWAATPEIVAAGLLVEPKSHIMNPSFGQHIILDPQTVADALEQIYQDPKQFGDKGRRFAESLDHSRIMPLWKKQLQFLEEEVFYPVVRAKKRCPHCSKVIEE